MQIDHKEFYISGELKCEGKLLQIVDCTSRGSGNKISIDEHESCVECLYGTTLRKTGLWNYYYKQGSINFSGNYVILDYIGVPSMKDGLWCFYRENGSVFQQIMYNEGNVIELCFFDEDGIKIE
jgi:antitoxin component YwqK of YwqJK toxin-antitoxin module